MSATLLFEAFWIAAFALAFRHSVQKSGAKNAFLFFIPAFLWGFMAEFVGVNVYGIYTYPSAYSLSAFGVPFAIAFGWAAIIYVGYYITANKLHIKNFFRMDVDSAVISASFDFIVLEPMAFIYRLWNWNANNFWFGAPFFNFVGWLFVVSIFIAAYNWACTETETSRRVAKTVVAMMLGFAALNIVTAGYLGVIGKF